LFAFGLNDVVQLQPVSGLDQLVLEDEAFNQGVEVVQHRGLFLSEGLGVLSEKFTGMELKQ